MSIEFRFVLFHYLKEDVALGSIFWIVTSLLTWQSMLDWCLRRCSNSLSIATFVFFHIDHEITSSARSTFCFTNHGYFLARRKVYLYCSYYPFISFMRLLPLHEVRFASPIAWLFPTLGNVGCIVLIFSSRFEEFVKVVANTSFCFESIHSCDTSKPWAWTILRKCRII